jgi:hypothetical protein
MMMVFLSYYHMELEHWFQHWLYSVDDPGTLVGEKNVAGELARNWFRLFPLSVPEPPTPVVFLAQTLYNFQQICASSQVRILGS